MYSLSHSIPCMATRSIEISVGKSCFVLFTSVSFIFAWRDQLYLLKILAFVMHVVEELYFCRLVIHVYFLQIYFKQIISLNLISLKWKRNLILTKWRHFRFSNKCTYKWIHVKMKWLDDKLTMKGNIFNFSCSWFQCCCKSHAIWE